MNLDGSNEESFLIPPPFLFPLPRKELRPEDPGRLFLNLSLLLDKGLENVFFRPLNPLFRPCRFFVDVFTIFVFVERVSALGLCR